MTSLSKGMRTGGYMSSEQYGYYTSDDYSSYEFLMNSVVTDLDNPTYVPLYENEAENFVYGPSVTTESLSQVVVGLRSFANESTIDYIPCNTMVLGYVVHVDVGAAMVTSTLGNWAQLDGITVSKAQTGDYLELYNPEFDAVMTSATVDMSADESQSLMAMWGVDFGLMGSDVATATMEFINERWQALATEVPYIQNVRRDIFKRVKDPLKLSLNNFGSMGIPEAVPTLTTTTPADLTSGDIISVY